jgi:hypothetical protein
MDGRLVLIPKPRSVAKAKYLAQHFHHVVDLVAAADDPNHDWYVRDGDDEPPPCKDMVYFSAPVDKARQRDAAYLARIGKDTAEAVRPFLIAPPGGPVAIHHTTGFAIEALVAFAMWVFLDRATAPADPDQWLADNDYGMVLKEDGDRELLKAVCAKAKELEHASRMFANNKRLKTSKQ